VSWGIFQETDDQDLGGETSKDQDNAEFPQRGSLPEVGDLPGYRRALFFEYCTGFKVFPGQNIDDAGEVGDAEIRFQAGIIESQRGNRNSVGG
jgi:hypothetical protein